MRENCGVNGPEINKVILLMERHREILQGDLVKPQKDTFDKYAECSDEYAELISEQAFCAGFSLASRLLSEALMDKT